MNVDGLNKFQDAGETAFADHIVGELAEESLHQIEPGGACRGKMQMHATMLGEPRGDDMDGLERWHSGGIVRGDRGLARAGVARALDFT